MHLCEPCRASRDWEDDPVVKTKIALNLQQRDENRRARCGTCRTFIRNPLFQICARCADAAKLCQNCSKSTESPEALAAREASEVWREWLIDLFTQAVKTYGITASRDLFREQGPEVIGKDAAEFVLRLDHRDIDYGRENRPIMRLVFGPNVYRHRFCASCSAIPKRAPAIVKADLCGHWTTSRSPAYCPVCAAGAGACESCGVSG